MNKFNNEEDLISFLKEKAESNLVAEMCSLIGVDNDGNYIYKMMKNRSKNPEAYFVIDAYEFLSFMKDKKMTFVFHTHLFSNEEPSEMDKKSSENCCLAYLIYSVISEKFYIYEPQTKDYDVNVIKRLKEKLW